MAISAARKQAIGRALASLIDDVSEQTLSIVKQYRSAEERMRPSLIKQAVDTPHRARAQIQAWMESHDAERSPGAAQTFLSECLVAAGSTMTLAQINAALSSVEAKAQTLIDHVVNDGWTWDQVAAAIEAAIGWEEVKEFTYMKLPIPDDYVTVWGEQYR